MEASRATEAGKGCGKMMATNEQTVRFDRKDGDQYSLWLMGVFRDGAFGLVGPFLLALTTPGALGFGVPYWNFGTSLLAAAD